MSLTLPAATGNAACDAIVDLVDAGAAAGYLLFETSGDATVAVCTMSDPAFGAASNGTATASAISDESSATAGTVSKFEMRDSDDTQVLEGTVTVTGGGGDITLSSVAIGAGDTVSISALTLGVPLS